MYFDHSIDNYFSMVSFILAVVSVSPSKHSVAGTCVNTLVFAEHKNVFGAWTRNWCSFGARIQQQQQHMNMHISFVALLLAMGFMVQCTHSIAGERSRWHRQHQCLVVVILSVGFTVYIHFSISLSLSLCSWLLQPLHVGCFIAFVSIDSRCTSVARPNAQQIGRKSL